MGSRQESSSWAPSRGCTTTRRWSFSMPGFFASSSRLIAADIYRSEPTRRRECLYYLALGHYKMGNYDEAKSFNCESPSLYFPLLDTNKHKSIQLVSWKRNQRICRHSLLILLLTRPLNGVCYPLSIPRKLADCAQRDILAWLSQAVLRQWAHFY